MLKRIAIVFFVLFVIQPALGTSISPVTQAIRERVQTIRTDDGLDIAGQRISSTMVLPAFYERRNYTPAWTDPQVVRQLIDALEHIDADGLVSRDYHLPDILKLQADGADHDPETAAGFDILMTDALIRLGYHLLAGKVDPEALDPHWNMTTTLGDLDTILSMGDAIESARIPQLIDVLRPDHPYYLGLRRELTRYRAIRDQGGWTAIPAGPTLKPGMSDERVPLIRERLTVTGELTGSGTDATSKVYDESLEVAVKRFQQHHALTADGILGAATLAAMNVPVQERIDQIKVNLERARWGLRDLPDDVVIVDIAGFEVSYRRGGGNYLVDTRAGRQTVSQNTGVPGPDPLPGGQPDLDGTANHIAQ